MIENPLLVVLGPTASGKTRLAVRLAAALQGEIISADSRQVFKGMDIGTGKDLSEYFYEGNPIPYHLINIKAAGEHYNVNEYKEEFYRIFEDLTSRQLLPVLCGGTGMYIHSILQRHEYTAIPSDEAFRSSSSAMDGADLRKILAGYPAQFTAQADLSSHKRMIRAIEIAVYLSQHELDPVSRPQITPFVAGLNLEVAARRNRIYRRLIARFEEGLIEEVKGLLEAGVSREMLTFYGLEYKFIVAYLNGELNYVDLLERLSTAIYQFAKRQMTFFRKMEKDGVKIHWFEVKDNSEALFESVLDSFSRWKSG
ncbi:MAG: tRNA (adenosine(37)-N6)-dimethylallyltransferase MiaA [Bacteroidota bacterium]